jgi:uncharacterized OB-fold protein
VFFEALRDRGVFLGSRCENCGITYLPARMFCERCFGSSPPDVECGPGGFLESFTIGYIDVNGEPLGQPQTLGLVKLDGADTVLMHRILEGDQPLEIGSRVGAVLNLERTGSILDVEGFRVDVP